jgi:hypothetical protein
LSGGGKHSPQGDVAAPDGVFELPLVHRTSTDTQRHRAVALLRLPPEGTDPENGWQTASPDWVMATTQKRATLLPIKLTSTDDQGIA